MRQNFIAQYITSANKWEIDWKRHLSPPVTFLYFLSALTQGLFLNLSDGFTHIRFYGSHYRLTQ